MATRSRRQLELPAASGPTQGPSLCSSWPAPLSLHGTNCVIERTPDTIQPPSNRSRQILPGPLNPAPGVAQLFACLILLPPPERGDEHVLQSGCHKCEALGPIVLGGPCVLHEFTFVTDRTKQSTHAQEHVFLHTFTGGGAARCRSSVLKRCNARSFLHEDVDPATAICLAGFLLCGSMSFGQEDVKVLEDTELRHADTDTSRLFDMLCSTNEYPEQNSVTMRVCVALACHQSSNRGAPLRFRGRQATYATDNS